MLRRWDSASSSGLPENSVSYLSNFDRKFEEWGTTPAGASCAGTGCGTGWTGHGAGAGPAVLDLDFDLGLPEHLGFLD